MYLEGATRKLTAIISKSNCVVIFINQLREKDASFFTALNDGATSALISFGRTLVFQIAAVLILPVFLDVDGIWGAVILAEALAGVLSAVCFVYNRKKYNY